MIEELIYGGYHKPLNYSAQMINELFAFRAANKLEEDSLIDTIFEFCRKNNYDPIEFAENLGDVEQIKDIIEKDCQRHGYVRNAKIIDTYKWW